MAGWGTGKPKVELLSADGSEVYETYTLPYPTSREFDWPEENDDRRNPLTKRLIIRNFGFRPRQRLFYQNIDSSDLDSLIKIANQVKATGSLVRFTPHLDVAGFNYICKPQELQTSYRSGKSSTDSVAIEFLSIELFKEIVSVEDLYISYHGGINRSITG